MRRFTFLSVMALTFAFAGCPEKTPVNPKPENKPTPVSDSEKKTGTKPAAAMEPATLEAKRAVELVKKLNGKYTLTPAGTVKSIEVDSDGLSAENFKLIAQQKDLESLFISNYRELNDAMVADLSGLKKLTKIRFRNSGISDTSLKTIAVSFPGLTVLEIPYNTLLTDSALKEVGKLKKLEKLDLTYCNFGEFGVMDIVSLPDLKSVDIRGNMQIGNMGLDLLTGLPSLRALKHMSQAADDGGIEALSKAKNLTELEIQDFNITDRAGEFLKQFDKLTYLSIFRCQGFGSEGLLHLKGTKLTRLDLRDLPSLNNEGMVVFKELPSLKRLYLRELASVSDDGLVNISSLKDLENLNIWDLTNVSDETVEKIAKLPNLKVLLIRNTGVSDASVDILLKAPKLQDLTFTNNAKVSAAGLKKLAEAKKFKKLDTKPYVPNRQ